MSAEERGDEFLTHPDFLDFMNRWPDASVELNKLEPFGEELYVIVTTGLSGLANTDPDQRHHSYDIVKDLYSTLDKVNSEFWKIDLYYYLDTTIVNPGADELVMCVGI